MQKDMEEISPYDIDNKEKEKILITHRNVETSRSSPQKIQRVGLGDQPLESINMSIEVESSSNTEINDQNFTKKNLPYKEKSKFKNTLRMFILVTGMYFFGYYIVITNVLGKVLTKEVYKMEDDAGKKRIGDLGSLHSIGGFFSIILTGFFTSIFGRVKLLIGLELLMTISCFLHRIESMELLLVLRFFDGFLGALNFSIIPSLIKELLPERLGPVGGNLTYTLLVAFLLLASLTNYIFGGYEGLTKNWKLAISLPGYLGIVRFFMLIVLFSGLESPAYYIDHFFKEKKILKEKILKDFKEIYVEDDAKRKTDDLINEEERILKKLGLKERKKIGFKALFSPKYKNRFIVCAMLNCLQQLTGINFLVFYSTQLFDEISGNGAFITLLLSFGNFTASIVAIGVTHMGLGRRKGLSLALLIIIGAHSSLLVSLILKWGWLSAMSLFVFIIAFGAGLGSTLSVFMAEALPPYGVGVAMSCQFLASSILVQVAVVVLPTIGIEVLMGFFVFCSFLCFVYIRVACKETKGLTEEEITELYLPKKNK